MNKFTMYFFTNCTDSRREEEFNSWYSHIHIPDLSAATGLSSAKRYVNQDPNSKAKYVAVYEFTTENIQHSLRSFFLLVRRSFENGRHIDCIESVTSINTPLVSCYKEMDPAFIKRLPSREYPKNVPSRLDKMEEHIQSFQNGE